LSGKAPEDHLGQPVEYLGMNNIIPPDSRPGKPSKMWAVDSLASFRQCTADPTIPNGWSANRKEFHFFRIPRHSGGQRSSFSMSDCAPGRV